MPIKFNPHNINCPPWQEELDRLIMQAAPAYFHGYYPNPHHPKAVVPPPKPDPIPVVIPKDRMAKAVAAHAKFIAKDGSRIYKDRFGLVEYADWDGNDYGSWWSMNTSLYPTDVVEVK